MSRNDAGTVRTGVHVHGVRSGCAVCGHPRTLHSNGTTPCMAKSCHAGPQAAPCPRFDDGTQGEVLLAS